MSVPADQQRQMSVMPQQKINSLAESIIVFPISYTVTLQSVCTPTIDIQLRHPVLASGTETIRGKVLG
jgi:hypothetical protein